MGEMKKKSYLVLLLAKKGERKQSPNEQQQFSRDQKMKRKTELDSDSDLIPIQDWV